MILPCILNFSWRYTQDFHFYEFFVSDWTWFKFVLMDYNQGLSRRNRMRYVQLELNNKKEQHVVTGG